jgi:hypothetical protein
MTIFATMMAAPFPSIYQVVFCVCGCVVVIVAVIAIAG